MGSESGATVTIANGELGTTNVSGFDTIEAIGGSGNNDFSVSGSFQNVILQGGSGPNSFTVTGAGNYNIVGGSGTTDVLTIQCDNNGDTVHLTQNGSVITVAGSLTGVLTNITSLTVIGGTGNEILDASGMTQAVTLESGAGRDTLVGGAGNDTLYYGGDNGTYDGGGGTKNQLIYRDTGGDTIIVFTQSFYDDTTHMLHTIGRYSKY